jgi:hypothetical protein
LRRRVVPSKKLDGLVRFEHRLLNDVGSVDFALNLAIEANPCEKQRVATKMIERST